MERPCRIGGQLSGSSATSLPPHFDFCGQYPRGSHESFPSTGPSFSLLGRHPACSLPQRRWAKERPCIQGRRKSPSAPHSASFEGHRGPGMLRARPTVLAYRHLCGFSSSELPARRWQTAAGINCWGSWALEAWLCQCGRPSRGHIQLCQPCLTEKLSERNPV